MPMHTRTTTMTVLLLVPLWASATLVQRCEDGTGRITFTTLGCPPGHDSTSHDVNSPLTGTVAPPSKPTEPPTQRSNTEIVIVGQRDDGCGNVLSPEQRRKAIINQETPTGMTKKDVESLLGKPDKVIGRNAEVRYVYAEKKGRSRHVTFDEHGCVKGTLKKRKAEK